jgi:NAD(P)-dependent dehydrogenase (short-subunit alcohol dehydrogenase family)
MCRPLFRVPCGRHRIAATEIPVGRAGTAEDIGDTVVFLGADASGFTNAVNLVVDGGQTQVYAGKL